MFCTRCGATNSDVARFCSVCGAPLGMAAAAVPVPGLHYSGFWKRFLAVIIDGFIFTPVIMVMFAFTGALGIMAHPQDFEGMAAAMFGLTMIALMVLLGAGHWLYYTLMESSLYQATLGKIVVGAIVTDLNGNRISFARANGRYFGKWISGAIFDIGFLMAAFTEKQQALHDILAGTLVIQK